ncbi:hypothetical protein HELRODRAFT_158624 [Helobdella robusta]|uniref:Uncharacterized protein n=1 Tax=Helobdella robusta TaxID=6412 RepID=T1EN10_HELRO|nr:hypothetical protein HELRODRAFT_158624 [Helobdella robusta]ESO12160.1 hypothetical protein HELRODRAFT_158624 [Helobdella robusta]
MVSLVGTLGNKHKKHKYFTQLNQVEFHLINYNGRTTGLWSSAMFGVWGWNWKQLPTMFPEGIKCQSFYARTFLRFPCCGQFSDPTLSVPIIIGGPSLLLKSTEGGMDAVICIMNINENEV